MSWGLRMIIKELEAEISKLKSRIRELEKKLDEGYYGVR